MVFPILYLFYEKWGWSFWQKKIFWGFGLLTIILPLLWYMHALNVNRLYPSVGQRPGLFFTWDAIWTQGYWQYVSENLLLKCLTPVGFVLFIRGLFSSKISRKGVIWAWLGGAVFSFILFSYHTGSHRYYLLPILPVACLLIGHCLSLSDWGLGVIGRPYWSKVIIAMVTAAIIILSIQSGYHLSKKYQYALEASTFARKIVPDNTLIVSTKPLYYTHRHGWLFLPDQNMTITQFVEQLTDFIDKGASYYLVTHVMLIDRFPTFKSYLDRNFEQMSQDAHFYLYRLQ